MSQPGLSVEENAGAGRCERCSADSPDRFRVGVVDRGPGRARLCKECTDLATMGDIGVLASVITIQKTRR